MKAIKVNNAEVKLTSESFEISADNKLIIKNEDILNIIKGEKNSTEKNEVVVIF